MYKCQYSSNVQNTIVCTPIHKTSAHHPRPPFLTVRGGCMTIRERR